MSRVDNAIQLVPAPNTAPAVTDASPSPDEHGRIGLMYLLVCAVMLFVSASIDRGLLLDNESYLVYFEIASLAWLSDFASSSQSLFEFVTQLFTEEVIWRVWCFLLSDILRIPADISVRCTTVLLNGLVALAFTRLYRPLYALLAWVIVPFGFSMIGTYQIRQGFAFSLAFFFILWLKRPLLGLCLAAMIHTTMAVPFFLYILGIFGGKRLTTFLGVATIASIVGSQIAAQLFTRFGGRRAVFGVEYGVTSINFVFGCLIYFIGPMSMLLTADEQLNEDTRRLARLFVGQAIFLIACFVFFPVATSRVAYYLPLQWSVTFFAVKHEGRYRHLIALGTAGYMVYQCVRGYSLEAYAEILNALHNL